MRLIFPRPRSNKRSKGVSPSLEQGRDALATDLTLAVEWAGFSVSYSQSLADVIALKMTDIFGNDNMTLVPVTVG